MLSNKTLKRVSASYARGYRDGHAGNECIADMAESAIGWPPFVNYDYREGYRAGANDRKWKDADYSADAEAAHERRQLGSYGP